MRAYRLAALLVAVASGSCICVVTSSTSDLTILYTFDGLTCNNAGVEVIAVSVAGVDVDDGAYYEVDCTRFSEGLTISDLRTGSYDVDIEALDFRNVVIYARYGVPIEVDEDVGNRYDIDVPSLKGQLTLYWTFEGSDQCLDVVDVHVTAVDPAGLVYDDSDYACDTVGVIYDDAYAGVWSISMDGIDSANRILYTARNQAVTVRPNASNEYTIDLTTP